MLDEGCECLIQERYADRERGETLCLNCGYVLDDEKFEQNQFVEDSPRKKYGIAIKSQEEILPGDIEAFLPIKKKMEKSAEKGNYEIIDNREYAEENESWELIKRINIERVKLDGINEARVNRGEKKLTFFEHLDKPGQSELSDEYEKSDIFTLDIEELDRRIEKETKANKEAEAKLEELEDRKKIEDRKDWLDGNSKLVKRHQKDREMLEGHRRITETGWEGMTPWKAKSDGKKLLKHTQLHEELGIGLDELRKDMINTIHGAFKAERALYIQEGDNLSLIRPQRRPEASLEFYIHMSERGPFWFFHGYCRLFPVQSDDIDSILRSKAPLLSTQAIEKIDLTYQDCSITAQMMQSFVTRVGKSLEFETSGLEADKKAPLPYEDGRIPEELKKKISLCPRGGSDPVRFFRWVPFSETTSIEIDGDHKGAIKGVLRPSAHPIILTQIPLAYALAQRIFDSYRSTDQFRNIAMKILNRIEEDLAWCPASVGEMDRWWEKIVKESDSMKKSVTALRP